MKRSFVSLVCAVALAAGVLAVPARGAARPIMVWVSEVHDGIDVVVLYSDGEVSEPLNPPNTVAFYPTLSPDGTRVAFVMWNYTDLPANGWQWLPFNTIVVADLTSGRLSAVYQNDDWLVASPEWSPDGKRMMFVRYPKKEQGKPRQNSDLWVLEETAPEVWMPEPLSIRNGSEKWPEWSPDGRFIAYEYDPDDNNHSDKGESHDTVIAVSPADGSGPHRHLATGRTFVTDPVFSPDGRWIAYADYTKHWASGGTKLMVMKADGSGQRAIARNLRYPWALDFSPDGRFIAWGDGWKSSATRILQVEVDAPNRKALVFDSVGYDHMPEYFPVP